MKTYAPCTTDTLLGIARRDMNHAVEMLEEAGLPADIAAQLCAKIRNIIDGVWSTYGPGSIDAAVAALAALDKAQRQLNMQPVPGTSTLDKPDTEVSPP